MLKLYYANICQLEEKQIFHTIFDKVNTQRREKVLRCKNEKDKLRSLMAGYLLRNAVEQEGLSYEKLSFSVNENGKPFITNVSAMHFSLSHAGNYAVCLISDRCVGVDIEIKSRNVFRQEKQLKNIALKILSDGEYQKFSLCPYEKRTEQFLQYWTRKESYSKADGRGLGMDLKQVLTESDRFSSWWLDAETYLSIYTEDGIFSDLQIEKVDL